MDLSPRLSRIGEHFVLIFIIVPVLCCVMLVAEFADLLTDIRLHFLICVLLAIKRRQAREVWCFSDVRFFFSLLRPQEDQRLSNNLFMTFVLLQYGRTPSDWTFLV